MKRITDIIKSAEKNSLVNYDLQRDHSLSQSYPEGETAYFKRRIFELKQQIAEGTLIGRNWTEGYCSKDILTNDWIEKHTQIALKYMNETEVFKQLETFMYQYFNLLSYENLLQEEDKIKSELTLEQRILIKVYEGKEVIARGAEPSKEYQYYIRYSDTKNRIYVPGHVDTAKRAQNYYSRREKIIPYLSESVKKKAIDELQILKTNLESEFSIEIVTKCNR